MSHAGELLSAYRLFEHRQIKVRVMSVRARFTGQTIGPKEPVEAEKPLSQGAIL